MEIQSELYTQLKKANVEAMKNHDTLQRETLSVLLNKVMLAQIEKRTNGAELCDADVISILQKSIKEMAESKDAFQKANRPEKVQEIAQQIEFTQSFLPKMMSQEEIKAEIMKLEDKSIPSVMKHFKANFAGKCDMKDVQTVLKTL